MRELSRWQAIASRNSRSHSGELCSTRSLGPLYENLITQDLAGYSRQVNHNDMASWYIIPIVARLSPVLPMPPLSVRRLFQGKIQGLGFPLNYVCFRIIAQTAHQAT